MKKETYLGIKKLIDLPRRIGGALFSEKMKNKIKKIYFIDSVSEKLYQKTLMDFFKDIVRKDDLIFDIGANKGLFTEVFLKIGAEVVAVEPQQNLIKKIKWEYGKNDKVHIIQKGVSNEEGFAIFFINSKDVASSTFLESWKNDERFKEGIWDKKLKIEVTTLDKLISEFGVPKLIKIDVEGFEERVLKGLSKTKGIRYISFEFTKNFENFKSGIKCLNIIERLDKNVKFNYISSEFSKFKSKLWLNKEEIIKVLQEHGIG